MIKVDIYTDGACSGNPGPGGYGFIICLGDKEVKASEAVPNTTNNIMELTAVIEALEPLPARKDLDVTVYTDSQYVANGFNKGWVESWKKHNWQKSNGKPVKNIDLWKKLDALVAAHQVKFRWVRGHADNEYNNRCDQLAREAIRGMLEAAEDFKDSV